MNPFLKAYWGLVDASGLSDEEFEQLMEEAAAKIPPKPWPVIDGYRRFPWGTNER